MYVSYIKFHSIILNMLLLGCSGGTTSFFRDVYHHPIIACTRSEQSHVQALQANPSVRQPTAASGGFSEWIYHLKDFLGYKADNS